MPGALEKFRSGQGGAPSGAPSGGGGGGALARFGGQTYAPSSVPPDSDGNVQRRQSTIDLDEADREPSDFSVMHGGDMKGSGNGALIATGVGALGLLAALGLKRYGLGNAGKATLKGIANLRMASMLSGLAAPKSALGNVGAAVNVAMETGETGALREFFSRQTAKDWWNELKNPSAAAGTTVPGSSRYNPFGRLMGAGDVATRGALERFGLPAGEAERQVLQSPLPERVGHALNNPIAEHAVPFRRTPINQAIEGGATVTDAFAGPSVTRTYAGPRGGDYTARTRLPLAVHTLGGAATGYATADDKYPIAPGAYAAFAGRYGAPALIGALAGRIAAGGKGGAGLVGSALPVAEYGITQALDPRTALQPLDPGHTALARFLKRLYGEE